VRALRVRVERSDCAIFIAHEAVRQKVRVHIRSRDGATRIDACRNGECRAGIKRDDCAIFIAHEAVQQEARVHIISRDGATRVDACRYGTVRSGVRSVERSDCAIFVAHEAVNGVVHGVVCVKEVSCDLANRVDTYNDGTVGTGGGSVERSDCAIFVADEAVRSGPGRAKVVARDLAARVDGCCSGAVGACVECSDLVLNCLCRGSRSKRSTNHVALRHILDLGNHGVCSQLCVVTYPLNHRKST